MPLPKGNTKRRLTSSSAKSTKTSSTPKRRQTAAKRPVGRPRKTEATFTPKRHAQRKANGVKKNPKFKAPVSPQEAEAQRRTYTKEDTRDALFALGVVVLGCIAFGLITGWFLRSAA